MINSKAAKALSLNTRLASGFGGSHAASGRNRGLVVAQNPLDIGLRKHQLFVLMLLFALGAVFFLYLVGDDALKLKNNFQFYADSGTYLKAYNADLFSTLADTVGISENYLGPVIVLKLLGGNIYLVMLLNVYLFYHSIVRISTLLDLDPLKVGLLMLCSPITISSLLSVNKEIIVFPFIALALSGYVRRSVLSLVLALLVSILVRWQLTAFYLIVLALSPLSVFKQRLASLRWSQLKRRGLAIGLLVIAGSVFYVEASDTLAHLISVVEASVQQDNDPGSGLFTALVYFQSLGLYFLVFPFKALHLLFAMGLRVDRLLNPRNLYNDIIIAVHCDVTLILFLTILNRRVFTLRSDLIFLSCVFLAVFCLTPIYAPRYLYPVYVVWALVVAGAPAGILAGSKAGKRKSVLGRLGQKLASAG